MAGVEELDLGIGKVAAERLGAGGMKNGSLRPQIANSLGR